MSGCHPTETLQLCEHGVPIKFVCRHCAEDALIIDKTPDEKSEHSVMTQMEPPIVIQFREFEEKIKKLDKCQDELIYIMDRWFKRIEKLELLEQKVCDIFSTLEKRLDKLEEFKKEYFDQFSLTHSWITKIDATTSELVDKIAEIGNYYYKEKKQPYKCPVCEGKGNVRTGFKIQEVIGTELKTCIACHSCEGKGIVFC